VPKRFLLVATAAAALVVAGCGGGDDSSSNKTLSYAALGTEANKVCNEFNPQFDAIGKKLTGDPDKDAAVWDELIPKLEEGNAKMKALDPPEELKDEFDNLNALTDQQLDFAKKAQAAAKSGDKAAYDQVLKDAQASDLDTQSDLAASKIGAGDCVDKNGSQ
jgi:hypothetical protein